ERQGHERLDRLRAWSTRSEMTHPTNAKIILDEGTDVATVFNKFARAVQSSGVYAHYSRVVRGVWQGARRRKYKDAGAARKRRRRAGLRAKYEARIAGRRTYKP